MSLNHTQRHLKSSPHLSFLKRHYISCQIILIHRVINDSMETDIQHFTQRESEREQKRKTMTYY